jgi:hypothetical protein
MRSLACGLLIACGSPSVNGPRNAPGPIPGEAPPTSATEATAPPQPDPELAHPARPETQRAASVPVVTQDLAPARLATPGERPAPIAGPHLVIGDLALAGGTLEPQVAQRYLDGAYDALLACYTREQADVPSLAGKITARWTIERDGSVRAITASPGVTLTVGQCVGDVLRALHFPSSATAVKATVVLDFEPR